MFRAFGRLAILPALLAAALMALPGSAMAGKGKDEGGPVKIKQDDSSKRGGKKKGGVSTLPIVIAKPGAYQLVSNIDVTLDPTAVPETDAIQITADNVTLDLNGFQITGAGACTGTPVTSCDPVGDPAGGSGVNACDGAGCAVNATVMNGTVRGMAGAGVRLGDGARVHGVRAGENGEGGIQVGKNSVVAHSHADRNGSFGIEADDGSRLDSNTATGNAGAGAAAGDVSLVRGNVVTSNTTGLQLGNNTGYDANVASGNSTDLTFTGGSDAVTLGKNLCGNSTTCP